MTDMSVSGDEDVWMLYDRFSADGYPLIIRARIGNSAVDDFAILHRVTAVRCVADENVVDDYGMPQALDILYDIEDRLISAIGTQGGRAYQTATVTGEGQRVFYFAHDSDLQVDAVLTALSTPEFSLQAVTVDNLQSYRDLVTPTVEERQLNGDQSVISNLEKHGDDGTAPRKTDFWFYGDRTSLTALVAQLDQHGYTVDHWLDEPSGVVVTRVTPVDMRAFRQITPDLVNLAENHHVEYDGWETLVVKSETKDVAEPSEPKSKSLFKKLFGPTSD